MGVEYDGSFRTNGGAFSKEVEPFAVVAGRPHSSAMMEKFLRSHNLKGVNLAKAREIALDAWAVGHLAITDDSEELPSKETIAAHREEELRHATVEAALLDREARSSVTYREL
jgi:hypothetical protein